MIELRSIPPAISHAKVRKAVETYQAHHGEFRQVSEERYHLEQTRDNARELDVAAAASAHRSGQPDPGQPNLAKHDARIAELTHRQNVLAEVVRRDVADVLSEIDAGADKWREQLDRRAADARGALAAALDQVGACHAELASAYAVSGWLDRVLAGQVETAQYNPLAYASLPANRFSNGERRRADEIIGELRVLTEAPKPAQSAVGMSGVAVSGWAA